MSAQQRSSPSAEEGPSNKKHKADAEMKRFFRSWAWKREHRPDKDRFQRPYKYILMVDGQSVTLTIQQQKFLAEGFASTVWDSSIVVAKYLEKWPVLVRGKRCLDLSAGCGLVGEQHQALDKAPSSSACKQQDSRIANNCCRCI
eukprot:GHRR01036920.1.p1 GENE.GHRR01036920.1~~GHRR01036920.1.p1  ORF type:complete len:144 (+),score=45.34 GHRR01036920.1:247-678(+)